jgi:hypothetical protein
MWRKLRGYGADIDDDVRIGETFRIEFLWNGLGGA